MSYGIALFEPVMIILTASDFMLKFLIVQK